ncbi:MAG TPA: hypothetical protein VHT28_12900 [Silvibacterium sp.]|nr:hypothetical protein [Silvibacterium sp.]
MTNSGWVLVEVAARLLARDEREAVLGDLVESGESAWRGVPDVFGLALRRQALLWKSWRPWLAAFGLTLPSSFLLMGASLSVSSAYQRVFVTRVAGGISMSPGGLWVLACGAVLLMAWSWTGGFLVGALSRRTLWASALLCISPCFFCLTRFRIESLSRLCLLLFLVPAISGVCQGVRLIHLKSRVALALAVTATTLMVLMWSSGGFQVLNLMLMWPAWYIAATARNSGNTAG